MATHPSTIFLILTACAASCSAAIAWEKARVDPDFPGRCLWEKRNGPLGRHPPPLQMFQPGESWDIESCAKAICTQLGDDLFIQYVSCGSVGAEPPCKVLPQNNSLPYPECCPNIWCPETPPRTMDDFIRSNEIDKGSWEEDPQYQHFYQLFF
ncbi:hypothetical protein J437_LFUL011174 [Ladona fulva]|uniref:Single domain-containing protein n=1 Tax=Ladona fulva TaxID=123851 RepID=A0A8K0P2E3_LADFU|nr:hypothetical protein J437_LFUL011174 [Ladona fulva]